MSEQAGKYARFELERRFLLDRLPSDVVASDGRLIADHYITGTRLRLRRMERLDGGETTFKLGRKDVLSPPDFSRVTITTIYVSIDEYEVFAALPARMLRKRRYPLTHGGRVYSVDAFAGQLEGLVLAEVGFETTAELDSYDELPDFALRDVSCDVRFTGGALAALNTSDAADLLRELAGATRQEP